MHRMCAAGPQAAAPAPNDAGLKQPQRQPHADVAAIQHEQHKDDHSNGMKQVVDTESQQCSSVNTVAVLRNNRTQHDSFEHSARGVVEQQANSNSELCALLCAGNGSAGANVASRANRDNAGLVCSSDTASNNIGHQLLEHSRAGRYACEQQPFTPNLWPMPCLVFLHSFM